MKPDSPQRKQIRSTGTEFLEDLKEGKSKGYQWPASSLTGHEMAILADWRDKTGTPISQLLKQAVNKCQEIIGGER